MVGATLLGIVLIALALANELGLLTNFWPAKASRAAPSPTDSEKAIKTKVVAPALTGVDNPAERVQCRRGHVCAGGTERCQRQANCGVWQRRGAGITGALCADQQD